MKIQKLFIHTNHFSLSDVQKFLLLALPSVVSTGIDALLGFTDRLFLSYYKAGSGEAYLNAGLVGGITAFVIMAFFIVTAGYSNALVAQFLGAKQKDKCAKVISQGFFFSIMAYPFIILLSLYIGKIYALFNHSPLQHKLETEYTQIILFGAVFSFLRSAIGGFFIGIQKTKVVMFANLSSAAINIPLNYFLIFGWWIFPELGINGAAIATVISAAISLAILLAVYLGEKINKEFRTRRKPIFNFKLFKKLIRFGTPSGVETFVAVMVFDFFIILMSAYGEAVGAAVTIAINWDTMFFVPMRGAGFATTSLVGNAMGANNIEEAKKATRVSTVVMLVYAVLVIFCLIVFTAPLVEVFLTKMKNAQQVRQLAVVMVRLACTYLFFDALHISFGSSLAGAGDTKATMKIFLFVSGLFGVLLYTFVFTQVINPIGAWLLFVGYAVMLGAAMTMRYLKGRWQTLQIID